MQHHTYKKTESFDILLQDARQQEAASLAEALERWLDDGGASDIAYQSKERLVGAHIDARAVARTVRAETKGHI
jgi:hypothetical protein